VRIFVDENIPKVTVVALRALGHDVLDIRGSPQQGMFDDELWQLAQHEGRLLVTTDKGFSEYRQVRHHGILLSACGNRLNRAFTRER
jgi:predicted nuclease of predicted toxin-antitoxin system